MRTIRIVALVAPLWILGCEYPGAKEATLPKPSMGDAASQKKTAMIAVPEAVVQFLENQGEWPQDFLELRRWMEASRMDVELLSTCSDLEIAESANGNGALLRFKIREPGFSSDVEIVLPSKLNESITTGPLGNVINLPPEFPRFSMRGHGDAVCFIV